MRMWILFIAVVETLRLWLLVRAAQQSVLFGSTAWWTWCVVLFADWFCMSVLCRVLNEFWPFYPSDWMRRRWWLGPWLRARVRLQVEMEKPETKLNASEPYIFASHSHGILSTAQMFLFMFWTPDTVLGELPKNTISMVGSELMVFPLTNLICRLLGSTCISERHLAAAMLESRPLLITPGGAKEMSLVARDGKGTVHILKRTGFLRLALQNRRPVVPLLTFGNHSMYRASRGPAWLCHFSLRQLNYGFPLFALGEWNSIVPLPDSSVKVVVLEPILPQEDELLPALVDRYYQHLVEVAQTHGVKLVLVEPNDLDTLTN